MTILDDIEPYNKWDAGFNPSEVSLRRTTICSDARIGEPDVCFRELFSDVEPPTNVEIEQWKTANDGIGTRGKLYSEECVMNAIQFVRKVDLIKKGDTPFSNIKLLRAPTANVDALLSLFEGFNWMSRCITKSTWNTEMRKLNTHSFKQFTEMYVMMLNMVFHILSDNKRPDKLKLECIKNIEVWKGEMANYKIGTGQTFDGEDVVLFKFGMGEKQEMLDGVQNIAMLERVKNILTNIYKIPAYWDMIIYERTIFDVKSENPADDFYEPLEASVTEIQEAIDRKISMMMMVLQKVSFEQAPERLSLKSTEKMIIKTFTKVMADKYKTTLRDANIKKKKLKNLVRNAFEKSTGGNHIRRLLERFELADI